MMLISVLGCEKGFITSGSFISYHQNFYRGDDFNKPINGSKTTLMLNKWKKFIDNDPFNPNLSRAGNLCHLQLYN
jgi:hypothetical protein